LLGNITRCWDMFKIPVLDQLNNKDIVVKQSVLWEDAALIGAVCSWPDAELQ
jgi:glucokinase